MISDNLFDIEWNLKAWLVFFLLLHLLSSDDVNVWNYNFHFNAQHERKHRKTQNKKKKKIKHEQKCNGKMSTKYTT